MSNSNRTTNGTNRSFVTRKLATLSAALVVGLFALSAQAFPNLDLEVQGPDLFAGAIDVNYAGNNAGGMLTATGFASTLTPPGSGPGNIAGGSFNINANINFNAMTADGSLDIGGTIAGLGFNSGTLLTGNFVSTAANQKFGAGAGDPLEFLFNVTGGDAAALYGGIGATTGVILSQTGYGGSFAGNFNSGGFHGLADTFGRGGGVPIPGTLWLLLVGGGLLLSRQKATSTKKA